MTTLSDRFWIKVERTDSCWLWTANKSPDGYGRFAYLADFGTSLPHRIARMALVGPIPEGHELDHLCGVRHCVNPDHLEPVTHQENVRRAVARRTHCPNGHLYADGNSVSDYAGGRRCLTCRRETNAAYMRRRRAVARQHEQLGATA